MKETCIIIVIICIVVTASVLSQQYIKKQIDCLLKELEDLKIEIIAKKDVEAISKINKIYDKWQGIKDKLSVLVDHVHLDKVQSNIISIKAGLENNEKSNLLIDIEKTKSFLIDIEEINKVKLKNVF